MTYRKELPKLGISNGGLSGKFGYNLGKRFGGELASLSVPKDDDENRAEAVEQFWVGLEDAANRLIQSKEMTMKRMEFSSEEEALSKFGEVIFDAGQLASRDKRIKKELKAAKEAKEKGEAIVPATTSSGGGGAVSVGQLSSSSDSQLFSLSLLHGDNLVPLSSLGRIQILRENPKNESNIVCNKKKCEVTIKFCVVPSSSSSDDNGAAVVVENGNNAELDVTSIEGSKAMSKEIRLEEGTNYELWTQQMRVEAMSTLSATTTAQEEEKETAATTAEATVDTTQAAAAAAADDMVVTAFEVTGSIDYNKLIEQFGSKELTPYLLRRLENVTVKQGTVDRLHRFLRREIFFSHRDIEKICELLEGWYGVSPPPMDGDHDVEMTTTTASTTPANKPTTPCPIYLYTGRGPSSAAMHLGHLVPFLFTAWLQKAFQCPLVIQMTDDEKFIFKGEYTSENSGDGTGANGLDPNRTGDNLDYFANLTTENAKDIIACDFIPDKTFLFSDLDYVGRMYPNIVRIWKAVTVNQVNGVFGFDSSANIGKTAFPAIQAAPSFGSSFPNVLGGGDEVANPATLACLIPCAIDQDPYFRLTRDIAHKLVPSHHPLQGKPSLIHSKFFPPLQGAQGKMSSSDANSAIFLTDTPEDIERKIKQHAFSGGQDTKKKQEELGANLDVDVSYQWLRFFLEDDDELIRIGKEYGSGSGEHWSTGKVKAKLVAVLKDLVEEHQERRNAVTDEVVKQWMTERCIL